MAKHQVHPAQRPLSPNPDIDWGGSRPVLLEASSHHGVHGSVLCGSVFLSPSSFLVEPFGPLLLCLRGSSDHEKAKASAPATMKNVRMPATGLMTQLRRSVCSLMG